ncbi:MAG TPA: neutral/alkaline non-lysosomal ceramidase N-terminal domain-containing protein [Thermoleophilaceae bacterium]
MRRLAPALVVGALMLALAASPAGAATNIDVGVGRADITPPTGYYMMGWVRSDGFIVGQHTRLWARVIVLRQGKRKIALITEDLNGIPGGMLAQAADMLKSRGYSQQNVLDSASHTHAAPTSFYNFSTYNSVFMTQRTPTDFDLSGTRDQRLYAFMVRRLALAIRRADSNLGPGAVGWGATQITNLTANRSLEAHLADHGIQLGYGQGSPSQDPDGALHTIDPNVNVLRVDKYLGGHRVPVGMWSTFADHGTVNKFQFTYYNEDHHGAATQRVESAIRSSGHVPAGQDVVNAYGNTDEGDMSAGLTRSGPAAADYVGSREATAFLSAWKQAGGRMQRAPKLDWRWTRMCFCGQNTAVGPVADHGSFGLSQFTGSEEGRGPLFDVTRTTFEGDHLPVSVGGLPQNPVADPAQGDKIVIGAPLNVPKAVPLMALRIANRLIVSVPGEMTEEMGRRVRASVLGASSKAGISTAVISGLANEYADYFTTPEEYDAQHYEGGATIYGRASSVALQEALTALAGDLAAGKPAAQPYPYDPSNGVSPAGDAFSSGAASASVTKQPAGSAARLAHPSFSWQGGARGFDRPLDRAFVSVQRQVASGTGKPRPRPGSRGRGGRQGEDTHDAKVSTSWRTVDSDLALDILWTVDSNGVYTARWEVPLGAAAGKYRFLISGNRYGLASSAFTVRPTRALTAVAVNGGVELRYPPAQSHEAVGDPPGDVTADLTNRPAKASSGRATFVVDGKSVTVSAGTGGVFRRPAGNNVVLGPGAARDSHGNANGNGLTLAP